MGTREPRFLANARSIGMLAGEPQGTLLRKRDRECAKSEGLPVMVTYRFKLCPNLKGC
jgi:hypothetical protein